MEALHDAMDPHNSQQTKYISRRILIVDDNSEAAQSLGKLLALRGHTVRTASSGAETVIVVRDYSPNIIILDIGLPDMTGYDVALALRHNKTSAGLIALTGYGQEDDKRRAQEAGFDFHLTKPVGLSELEHVFSHL